MENKEPVITRQSLFEAISHDKEAFDKLQQSVGDVSKMRYAEYMRSLGIGKFSTLSQTVTTTLAGTKVLDEIVWGAEYAKHEGRVGREVARPVSFDDDLVVRLPKATPLGHLAIQHGYKVGRPPQFQQPTPEYTEFTVSDDSKIHRTEIAVSKAIVSDAKWNEVQAQLYAFGESYGCHENRDIILTFAGGGNQAWATDIYVTLTNAVKTMKLAGFYPDIFLVGPTGENLCLNNDKFIHAFYMGRAGEEIRTGQIGRFILGTSVFYSRFVEDLPAIGGKAVLGVLAEREKAVGFALKWDLQIEGFDDVREGVVGSVATSRYDVKLQHAAAAVQILAA